MSSGFKSPRIQTNSSKSLSIANATALTSQIQSFFSEIEDPRVPRTRAHLLVDILIIGILSVIAGGRGWEDMENYGLSKYNWLKEFLANPDGTALTAIVRYIFSTETVEKK